MVNAAGLAVLAIALTGVVRRASSASLTPFGGSPTQILPDGWELVVFAVGCGLVAYGAVDRAPGPRLPGRRQPRRVHRLRGGVSDDETLYFWPLLILALGLGVMFTGLRPRAPLPPEPSPYTTGRVPLASRSGGRARAARAR